MNRSKFHSARNLVVIFFVLLCFIWGLEGAFSDSIWRDTSASPYTVSKSFKVGDLVTVIILESTAAIQRAGTDTNVSDNLGTTFNHTITRLQIQPSNLIKGTADGKYKGLGATTRTSNVSAKVASIVTRVLPNGNLIIEGEHRVEVNDEVQVIKVSGMIRPKDVSLANTIYSYQVAGADVSVKGTGVVGEAERPGWFARFFNWVF